MAFPGVRQSNLIRIIDGILAKMPSTFGLTMAPETAYATGGSMSTSLVPQAYRSISGLKGLMTWSLNWDGSKNWTFGNNVKSLEGR